MSRSLYEAREWLEERLEEGASCPCCNQFAKIYKRKIHSTMARDLIRLYRVARMDWAHVSTAISREVRGIHLGDFAKLSYWGLVEEEAVLRDDGGRAGWWRVTETGRAYVYGMLKVPKYALVYDGDCLRLDGPEVRIHDALGDRFDYKELMAS